MKKEYDFLVIGSGPAGGAAARKCNAAGLKTAVAESRGYGGTCPLRGCVPKKVLTEAASTLARFQDMTAAGLKGEVGLAWRKLIEFKNTFTEPVSDGVRQGLVDDGLDVYDGEARFVDSDRVVVGEFELKADRIVVASGAKPMPLPIDGLEHLTYSEDFLNLDSLPARIVFIGGGLVSFEFAHVAAKIGAHPTILEMAPRPLGPFDPDLVSILVSASEKTGIKVKTDTTVSGLEKNGSEYLVHLEGGAEPLAADLVVHGAGRVPALDGLDLEKAGVDYDKKGILVDEYLRSRTNPNVWAVGDVSATSHPLTPVADMEARVAADNIIHGPSRKPDHRAIPSAVFTYPVLGAVGRLESQAEDEGLEFETRTARTEDWGVHRRIGLEHAGYKVLLEKGSGRILGAHVLGEGAEEMVNFFALAMRNGLTAGDLLNEVMAYPSRVYQIRHMLS